MQYLVTMEFIEPGPLMTPRQLAPVAENQTVPTLETCINLQAEGKIRGGGVVAGGRSFVFIADVPNNDDLDKMLQNIPAWLVTKAHVVPLQDFENRLAQNQKFVDQMKDAQL